MFTTPSFAPVCVMCVVCKKGRPEFSFCWAADDPAAARAVDSINSRPVMCGKKLGWGWEVVGQLYSGATAAVQSSIIVSFRQARIKNLAKWNGCRKPPL